MQVLWQLTTVGTCTFEWGGDLSYSLGDVDTYEYVPTHQHTYTVTGLTPGSIYHYRVTAGAEQFTGSFRAAPPANASRLKFFAYGDTRTSPADHNQVAGRVISTYVADPDFQTFILSVGDLVYHGDIETDWDDQFFNPLYPDIRTMLANLPYQSCMGNHEQTGALFTTYFPYPFVAGRYWSFDYGPAHFAVVDQYTPYSTGTPQLVWLANDLAATPKPWKFVYLHEPGWSAGGGHPNNTSVQTYIQPLCEQYDVAILFAGHNHYYARAVANGVQHVTTGGGGAPLKAPLGGYPNVVDTAMTFHHCEVEIDGGHLLFQAVTPQDSVFDSFEITLPGVGVEPGAGGGSYPGIWLGTATPNPFDLTASIAYSLCEPSPARLMIYDVKGRRVATLVDEMLPAGSHSAHWDGRDVSGRQVSAGIYFFRLDANNSGRTSKVILRK
jgi:hypothetical protein